MLLLFSVKFDSPFDEPLLKKEGKYCSKRRMDFTRLAYGEMIVISSV